MLETGPTRVGATLLVDRRGAPVALDRVGKQVRVRDRAAASERLRQVEERTLVAQMALEGVVQRPQALQLEMLSEHDRPRDQAEHRQAHRDDLADDVALQEDLDDVDGGKQGGGGQREHGLHSWGFY